MRAEKDSLPNSALSTPRRVKSVPLVLQYNADGSLQTASGENSVSCTSQANLNESVGSQAGFVSGDDDEFDSVSPTVVRLNLSTPRGRRQHHGNTSHRSSETNSESCLNSPRRTTCCEDDTLALGQSSSPAQSLALSICILGQLSIAFDVIEGGKSVSQHRVSLERLDSFHALSCRMLIERNSDKFMPSTPQSDKLRGFEAWRALVLPFQTKLQNLCPSPCRGGIARLLLFIGGSAFRDRVRKTQKVKAFFVALCISLILRFIVRMVPRRLRLVITAAASMGVIGTTVALIIALRWVLTPASLTRRSPFSLACRSIVLLKVAQSTLTEARIASSRSHLSSQAMATSLVAVQQQSLVKTLLDDSFFTDAFYAQTPKATMPTPYRGDSLGPSRAASPMLANDRFHSSACEVTPEEVEILIARAQQTLWSSVRFVAWLGTSVPSGTANASLDSLSHTLPSFLSFYRMLKGIWDLYAHKESLVRLCDRLGDGFAPSMPDADEVSEDVQHNKSQHIFAFHELYTHVQRLNGQLHLLRMASLSQAVPDGVPLGTASIEEQKKQSWRDLSDAMGALIGAWSRTNAKFLQTQAHQTFSERGDFQSSNSANEIDGTDIEPSLVASGRASAPLRAEMSAQGLDPIPLFPDDTYDEDVGSHRGMLPNNFEDLLKAMRNKTR